MQGVGSYDRFAIEWGYSEDKPESSATEEQYRLNAIVKNSIAKGIVWGNYRDPRWNAYDDGPDPVTWLKEVMPVRDALLAHYGPQMLRPGEPNSMLASRFSLIYLFHRYALAAAVNVVGSATVPLSLAGDGQKPVNIWPASSQKEALRLLLQALNPAELQVSPAIWSALAPAENGAPNPGTISVLPPDISSVRKMGRVPWRKLSSAGLLDRQRLQRLGVIADEEFFHLVAGCGDF